MNRLLFLFAFIFLGLIGCKKDYPVASTEIPVFYFNGTVNGIQMNTEAGVNNYYMYSFFTQDSNNVYNFFGELKQNNCFNCNNKIKFQINDYTSSPVNGATQINTSLFSSYYSLQESDSITIFSSTEYVVNFNAVSDSSNNYQYTWDFGDGTSETGSIDPVHTYTHPGYYTACLTVNDINGCTSSICNQIKVAVPDAECDVSIVNSVLSGNTISFSSLGTGTPSTYFWDFGDGSTSTLSTVSHTFSNAGIYKVCLEQTTDGGNCISYSCKNVSTEGFSGCLADFNYTLQGTNSNPFALSNIIITWTDNSGLIYTSNNFPQSSESYFQIISVENYLNNENNQTTKKLHIKFKCNLFNGNNSIFIDNGDAVIAVSYK